MDIYGYIKVLYGDYEGSFKMLRDVFVRDVNDLNICYYLGYMLVKFNRIEEVKKELEYVVNVECFFFKCL